MATARRTTRKSKAARPKRARRATPRRSANATARKVRRTGARAQRKATSMADDGMRALKRAANKVTETIKDITPGI